MNIFFFAFFPAKKKFLVDVQKHRGGDQGDFDNVQIKADFFPVLLPLAVSSSP
jgi:hypothetical protein